MDLYPKQPQLEKPPIAASIVLVAIQIVVGLLMVFVGSLITSSGGSGLSMVGAMVGAMGYASWVETKVPGALAKRSMNLWLCGICTGFQIALAFVYLGLIALAARSDAGVELPPISIMLLVVPFAGALFFGATWLGLWQGRRIIEKQREKAAQRAA